MHTDKRLIEDYIPIKAISAEASREKSIRHGHISTLHLWWARRPLVASRAAVFAALIPADAKPQLKKNAEDEEPMSLTEFMIALCKWNVAPDVLEEARRLIREQFPDSPPKVLDMFAGGGSIPLEALRLGCEAYALDLNPVAHIIQLATLVYPQKYGKQLAEDVKKWGEWVLEQVRAEVGDLYPLIPDPEFTEEKATFVRALPKQQNMFGGADPEQLTLDDANTDEADLSEDAEDTADVPPGYLQPVAYLWTRTVTCPNPNCRAVVPLVRQTWLKKKAGDNVALAMKPHPTESRMAFYVKKAATEAEFGFDPAGFSQRGNSVCGRCGTTVTSDYVKSEGKAGRMAAQMMATVCVRAGRSGKVYLSPDEHELPLPDESDIRQRIEQITTETGITPPDEEIGGHSQYMPVPIYGMTRFRDLFTFRQLLSLLTFTKWIQLACDELSAQNETEYAKALTTYLGIMLSRFTDFSSTICTWNAIGGRGVAHMFTRQALPMIWDYAETNPINPVAANWKASVRASTMTLQNLINTGNPAIVQRGSSTNISFEDRYLDAIVTDPPYYDNVPYADLSDYFYVWLKRSIGFLYPQHFSLDSTPKKTEAVAFAFRHNNDTELARNTYEKMMLDVMYEANRCLKVQAPLVIVYAHKTTAGWSTLVDALRRSSFMVTEAWPLETERSSRMRGQDSAALASSFFLVARKRENGHTADFETDVVPEMQRIVLERVRFFLQVGVTGADLNIAAVGAGLAPYTRYARVELPNGEELTAAAYLDEVQAEVARVLLGQAADTDDPTRYYLVARQYYGEAWVDFDEGNNLARALGPELDTGPAALTRGASSLVEKKGAKIRLRDYHERGDDAHLGMPTPEQPRAPLIDVLHRLLWLSENDNREIPTFLQESRVDRFKLRVVAEALKGRSLAAEPTPGAVRDERTTEQKMIDTLLAAWRRVVDEGKMI